MVPWEIADHVPYRLENLLKFERCRLGKYWNSEHSIVLLKFHHKLGCFIKHQHVMKLSVIKKGKMHQCLFPSYLRPQGFDFVRPKCCFLLDQFLGPEKPFPTGSELCQDTSKIHCTIPLDKDSGTSVLWVLLPYQLLPQVGEITLSDDYVALISRHQCFQKTDP